MKLAFLREERVMGTAALVVLLTVFTASLAYAQNVVFTQTMDTGSEGTQVSALQTYLSTKTTYYPEGLVTGYFGALTQAAVQRFQCAEEIVCSGTPSTTGYGRVGPKTLTQLNLRSGGSIGADVSAPYIFGITVATTSNSATVNFSTNEAARAQVYYASSPLTFSEAAGIGFTPMVSGAAASTDAAMRTSHAITIPGLATSTTYFFVAQAVDGSGNLSLTWPAAFKTNP